MRPIAALLALAGLALVVSTATASQNNEWVINAKVGGTTFTGTYTNRTGKLVNGVSIGTATLAKNPITSFTFNGVSCPLYAGAGSAYCYHISIPPSGARVSFAVGAEQSVSLSGSSKYPLSPAGFQACDTEDGGMDNDCVDVPLSSSGSAEGVAGVHEHEQRIALQLTAAFRQALSSELKADLDVEDGRISAAHTEMSDATNQMLSLQGSMNNGVLPPSTVEALQHDAETAAHDDNDVTNQLERTKSLNDEGKTELANAIKAKKAAIATLRKFTR